MRDDLVYLQRLSRGIVAAIPRSLRDLKLNLWADRSSDLYKMALVKARNEGTCQN